MIDRRTLLFGATGLVVGSLSSGRAMAHGYKLGSLEIGQMLLEIEARTPRDGRSGLGGWLVEHADDLCVVRSLHTEGVAHGPSTLFLHCGSTNTIRPSMGSWVTYGLGTENQNLPG